MAREVGCSKFRKRAEVERAVTEEERMHTYIITLEMCSLQLLETHFSLGSLQMNNLQ